MTRKLHQSPAKEMVRRIPVDGRSARRGTPLFQPRAEASRTTFPIESVEIDWERVIAQREVVLERFEGMPAYLLKPEVVALLAAEKHPTYRLIMDLMWTTGARISEVLALTPAHFTDDRDGFGVALNTVKLPQIPGRPVRNERPLYLKRYVPIADELVIDRVQSYLYAGHFRRRERLFRMARQTVNRHIDGVVERVGGAPFSIHAQTFRHSFAIHLLLHGRPLDYVSQLLGHKSVQSAEIYKSVLRIDRSHFLEGVDFH